MSALTDPQPQGRPENNLKQPFFPGKVTRRRQDAAVFVFEQGESLA
jgi:hypothetical protein